MDKYNTNRSLLSRVFPKNPQNTTGYHEKITTSQNKSEISRIKANFGRNCQNILNFAARVSLDTAQKNKKNQKTTANRNSCGFTLCN